MQFGTAACAVTALLFSVQLALAQGYPGKPIRFIILEQGRA